MGVFFDPKGLQYVQRGKVRPVHSLQKLATEYREGHRLFQFNASNQSIEEEHTRLVQTLERIPGGKIIVHDEAQSYGDSHGLEHCLSQLGNMEHSSKPTGNIRSLVATQRPWNLSEEHRANMPLKIWVGPFGTEARRFFETERMHEAAEAVKEQTGPFRWSVTDGGDFVETNSPAPEEYA